MARVGLFSNITMTDDEKWMRSALEEAREAYRCGEVPIGAVIVRNGKMISKGHNMTETLKDSTAHAEMIAITSAGQNAGKYLEGCTLYVTVEPCLMCAGAIGWSQLSRIVFGASDTKKGFTAYVRPGSNPFHPKAVVESGILEQECRELLLDFFRQKRGIF